MQLVQETIGIEVNNIPDEMKQYSQWVLWKSDDEKGKVLYSINGYKASSTNSNSWTSFDEVLNVFNASGYDGIGFVFSEDDPFTGIDLDDCFIDGSLSDEAKSTITDLNSYTERSPSGNGVHIIIKASKKPGSRSRTGDYEMYDNKRFFTMTGDHLENTPLTIEERQQEFNNLYERIFPESDTIVPFYDGAEQTSPAMEDDEIINVALKARNGERFKSLYTGDISSYPSQSEADLAICNMLAFYTQDPKQIDRLYRNSGLMRDKWDRDDYGLNAINLAIRDTKNRYKVFEKPSAVDDFKDIIAQKQLFKPYETHSGLASGIYPLTELGNAERIVHLHKDKIKYSPERGWLIWNGKRWKEDTGNKIEIIAAKTLRGIQQEAFRVSGDKKKKADILKWAKRCESRNIRLNAVADTRPHVTVSNDLLDVNPYLLNVKNGVIDLQKGRLLDHDPEHLITKLAPVKFDSKATAPRWEKFLQEIFIKENGQTDYDVIRFMQKAVGYSLSGDTSEEVIFFLIGSGGNGKSKFVEAVKNVLGDYGKQTNANTFIRKQLESSNINNDIARLDKARFVSAIESEQGQRLAESLVKQLTGGDEISARFLRREFFEFKPEFKVFFSTNYKPVITGTDDGIWRRVRLIPFNARFTGSRRDTDLSDKLEKELPGILNWAVKGFKLWKKEGLNPPQTIESASQSYRDEMDIIKPFLDRHCIVSENAKEEAAVIFKAYKAYCYEAGEIELNNRAFYRNMESRGFELKPGKGNKRFLHGVKLTDDFLT